MENNVLVLIFTWIGTISCGFFLLPQFIKIVKKKSAKDLSFFTSILTVLGAILWSTYLIIKATRKDLYPNLTKYDIKLLWLSASSDMGIGFFGLLILSYQIIWNIKNRHAIRLKMEIKKMSDEELLNEIAKIRKMKINNSIEIFESNNEKNLNINNLEQINEITNISNIGESISNE